MECSRTFKLLMSFQDHTKYFINIEDGVSRLSSVFLILLGFSKNVFNKRPPQSVAELDQDRYLKLEPRFQPAHFSC